MKLTEQQIADYHKNGYLVVNDVFSKEEMQIMLEHIEERPILLFLKITRLVMVKKIFLALTNPNNFIDIFLILSV